MWDTIKVTLSLWLYRPMTNIINNLIFCLRELEKEKNQKSIEGRK